VRRDQPIHKAAGLGVCCSLFFLKPGGFIRRAQNGTPRVRSVAAPVLNLDKDQWFLSETRSGKHTQFRVPRGPICQPVFLAGNGVTEQEER